VPGDALMLTSGVTTGFTVIVTLLVAVAGIAQGILLVRSTDTISPLAGVYAKVAPGPPEGVPFTYHWYVGAPPPFTGIAVKVTAPTEAHTFVPGLAVTVTEGVTTDEGLTVTGTTADAPTQPAFMTSTLKLPAADAVKEVAVAPLISTPPSCHW
jgi:hypothetical protein